MIEIQKGIPIPAGRGGSKKGKPYKYKWDTMEIGDSFFVPLNGRKATHVQSMLLGLAKKYNVNTGSNIRAETRTVVEDGIEGVRAWRTA